MQRASTHQKFWEGEEGWFVGEFWRGGECWGGVCLGGGGFEERGSLFLGHGLLADVGDQGQRRCGRRRVFTLCRRMLETYISCVRFIKIYEV